MSERLAAIANALANTGVPLYRGTGTRGLEVRHSPSGPVVEAKGYGSSDLIAASDTDRAAMALDDAGYSVDRPRPTLLRVAQP